MIAAVILAAALSGQAPQVYGPADAPPPKTAPPVKTAEAACPPPAPDPKSREILVCAPKPEGYRIDPDVIAARKAKRQALAGRPKPPDTMKDRSCAVVGPAGCVFDAPAINLLAAAATAGQIADRLSNGQEIGSIFVTDPQTSEYQYYQAAKKEREAKEAAKAAKALAAARKDAKAAPTAQPTL